MKKLILLPFLALLLYAQPVAAQVLWQQCYGGTDRDDAIAIRPTLDGGYILTGGTQSNNGDVSGNHGSGDVWVLKISATGAIEWQRCYGGSNDDGGDAIEQTADSGYIIAGATLSNDGEVSGNHGDSESGGDIWVLKISTSGDFQWQKCLGGSGIDGARAIRQTFDGGYIIAGITGSDDGQVTGNHGIWDAWIVKLNDTGGLQWERCYGGSMGDFAYDIQQTADSGYIFVGTSFSYDDDLAGVSTTIDSGGVVWVVKLRADNSIEWQKALGGSNGQRGNAIIKTSDGGYLVGGSTNSSNGDVTGHIGAALPDSSSEDGWVIKLDYNGVIKWNSCFFIQGLEYVNSLVETPDSGYIAAGVTGIPVEGLCNGMVARISDSGQVQWCAKVGLFSNDVFYSVAATPDGMFIGAGYEAGNLNCTHGDEDFWVVKLGWKTAVADVEMPQQLEVVPNPADAYLSITAPGLIGRIMIYNLLGQQVYATSVDDRTVTLDLSALPPGMYCLTTPDGVVKRFIKE